MSKIDVYQLIDDMSDALIKKLEGREFQIVGIRTGGVWLAKEIAKRLNHNKPIGELNISFYRDDFTQIGLHPEVTPSSLPFEVEGANLLLIDDVLMSGRTVRAAMNELFDYGRPSEIMLAVLLDLNRLQLPISASVIGSQLHLTPNQRVKLKGPENLSIEIQDLPSTSQHES